jgi:hypothetical protein
MPLDADKMLDWLRGVIGEWNPVDVTFGIDTVEAARGSVGIETQAMFAGQEEQYTFSVWAATGDFTEPPSDGDTVKIDGTRYRVIGIKNYAGDVFMRVDLGKEFQSRRRRVR